MTATTPADDTLTADDQRDLDAAIEELRPGAATWAELPLAQRAELMRRTHRTIFDNAERWAETAIAAKHVPAGPWEGEEWLSGPYAAGGNALLLARSLEALAAGRSPLDGVPTGTAPGGRTTLRVLPADLEERTLLNGFTGEIWLRPGVGVDQARRDAGLGARRVGENGGVGLVLGAGNISAIGPLDVLYELVAHNRASILKLNPTFSSLLPVLTAALAPLVELGVLRIVNGGAAAGGYLARHDGIDHVHITGSGLTHDAIVWGTGPEATQRRTDGTPALTKEITSELGGVAPIIVVPGEWSEDDLRFQAEHVVTQRLQNCGHNCIAGQTLVLSRDWPQREAFLDHVRAVLDRLPPREPWYPGSDRKIALATDAYPAAEDRGGRLLIEVAEGTSQELFTTEYFAPVLGHTALPGTGADFLRTAVAFANGTLDGTLGAGVIVAPADRKAMGGAFDEAIAELRYGTIGINVWSAFGFLSPALPWGAFPGHTIAEVGSGIGVVHNARLVADTERAVVTGPFRPFPRSIAGGEASLFPKPPWFVTARTAASSARHMTAYGSRPGWLRMPRIFGSAFRG